MNNTMIREMLPNEIAAFKSKEITEVFRSVAESIRREDSVHEGLDFDRIGVMDIV